MKKKILIIEDDPSLSDLLQDSLVELNLEIVSTDNGQVGLEILSSDPDIHLVVTDIVIPITHVPVVFLTGRQEHTPAAKELVPYIVLNKPVRPDDFKSVVANLIFK